MSSRTRTTAATTSLALRVCSRAGLPIVPSLRTHPQDDRDGDHYCTSVTATKNDSPPSHPPPANPVLLLQRVPGRIIQMTNHCYCQLLSLPPLLRSLTTSLAPVRLWVPVLLDKRADLRILVHHLLCANLASKLHCGCTAKLTSIDDPVFGTYAHDDLHHHWRKNAVSSPLTCS